MNPSFFLYAVIEFSFSRTSFIFSENSGLIVVNVIKRPGSISEQSLFVFIEAIPGSAELGMK